MAPGAVAPCRLARLDAAPLEVAADLGLVEGGDLQCEVFHVAARPARRAAARPAGLAGDGNEIDQVRTRPQLVEPEALDLPLDGAAEHAAVPLERRLDVGDAQHHMIQPEHLDGARACGCGHGFSLSLWRRRRGAQAATSRALWRSRGVSRITAAMSGASSAPKGDRCRPVNETSSPSSRKG